jgi:hypothetical protein
MGWVDYNSQTKTLLSIPQGGEVSSNILLKEDWVKVIESTDGSKALYSCAAFKPGDVLAGFDIAEILPEPTRHSIQYSATKHVLVNPDFLQFTNHSCDPNIAVHTKEKYIRAIRPIKPGDEIVYFYPSTEWSMAEPFTCFCQSPHCLTRIRGAAYLPFEILANYHLSDHIAKLLAKREKAAASEIRLNSRKAVRQIEEGEVPLIS